MNYSGDMSSIWGWFLWIGIIFLVFSSFGNWGYTYRAHRLYRDLTPSRNALDILNERYARGEINREEFHSIKNEILEAQTDTTKREATNTQTAMKPQTNVY